MTFREQTILELQAITTDTDVLAEDVSYYGSGEVAETVSAVIQRDLDSIILQQDGQGVMSVSQMFISADEIPTISHKDKFVFDSLNWFVNKVTAEFGIHEITVISYENESKESDTHTIGRF